MGTGRDNTKGLVLERTTYFDGKFSLLFLERLAIHRYRKYIEIHRRQHIAINSTLNKIESKSTYDLENVYDVCLNVPVHPAESDVSNVLSMFQSTQYLHLLHKMQT